MIIQRKPPYKEEKNFIYVPILKKYICDGWMKGLNQRGFPVRAVEEESARFMSPAKNEANASF